MKVKLLKVNVGKTLKTDKKNRKYKTCGIEAAELQFVYFYNILSQNDPVLNWKPGDQVDIETTDNGEWHNFKPITAYKPTTKPPYSPKTAPGTAEAPKTDNDSRFRLIEAQIAGLRVKVEGIEGKLNDLQNDGTIPE